MVLAFHAGRLGASLSFMGKGVTYYSSLCLVHLTHEMSAIDPGQVIHHSKIPLQIVKFWIEIRIYVVF